MQSHAASVVERTTSKVKPVDCQRLDEAPWPAAEPMALVQKPSGGPQKPPLPRLCRPLASLWGRCTVPEKHDSKAALSSGQERQGTSQQDSASNVNQVSPLAPCGPSNRMTCVFRCYRIPVDFLGCSSVSSCILLVELNNTSHKLIR
jgi:hypothetical protein